MLADDELIAPALAAIEAGDSAEAAWVAALNAEIAGYETSDDDYFRARAADLIDLRDRVLRNLSGADLEARAAGRDPRRRRRDADAASSRPTGRRAAASRSPAGSATSHVAMLARARGVPMVVGLGAIAFDGHSEAMVDGDTGAVVLSPGALAAQLRRDAPRRAAPRTASGTPATSHADAQTADGVPIDVMINVARPEEVDGVDVATCDGVGLMRTEFLFTGDALPDEETQYRAYAKVLDWAAGRPVTIRTIDAGGDKPVKGLTVEEANPFLGLARHPPVARAARDFPGAAPRACPRRAARQSQGHAADGDGAGRDRRGGASARRGAGRACRREALRRRARRSASWSRCRPSRSCRRTIRGGGVLLDRLERPHPVRHRRGARQPPRRRPLRRRQPGGDAAHRRCRRLRRAKRHRGEPLRRCGRRTLPSCRCSSGPGCAAFRSRRPCSAR